MAKEGPTTQTATADATSVTTHGLDLCRDVIGEHGFVEMLYFSLTKRFPSAAQQRTLNACLVALMEHGHNPSTLAARLAAYSNPDEIQVAMAVGLLNVGGVLIGTMDECGALLAVGVESGRSPADFCRDSVADFRARRAPLPGFGHRTHKPEDPRAVRLLEVGAVTGASGKHTQLLQAMSVAVDAAYGQHLPINATGATAALLLDIGIPARLLRGFAVVARAGGLLAHIAEEWRDGAAMPLVDLARQAIPYKFP